MTTRHRATVCEVLQGYLFALDGQGVRWFVFHSAMSPLGPSIHDVQVGTLIEGLPIDHPKGGRLIDVRVVPQ